MKLKAICMAALLLVASDAAAQGTVSGTISPADPAMTIVHISSNTCGVQSGPVVHYKTAVFTPTVSAMYTLSASSNPTGFVAFYLYQNTFNPLLGGSNCIAASLGNPVAKPLTAGTTYIVVLINNNIDQSVTTNYSLKISAPREKAVEFSNDLRSDMVAIRASGGSGAVTWWVSDSLTSGVSQFTWGTAGDYFLPGDYDGDGKADGAVWRPGPAGIAGFWIRRSSDGGTVFYPFGQNGDEPRVVGDYDGDGRTDIAIYRPGATPGAPSVWYYRRSLDGALVGVVWGQHGDFAVPGDFDGDGKNDFVVERSAGGQAVFVMNLTFVGISTKVFGASTDVVVPGDYDGDGMTDIMVVRGSFGAMQWWYRQSSSGSLISQTFGVVATDYLAPGDYDGDGKTDLAIWRADLSAGHFWISQSSGGIVARMWGQNGDYPVANWNIH